MQDTLPNSLQPSELQSPPAKFDPTNIILEIQDLTAASMLKDARMWVTQTPPKPGTTKRLNWDKSRSMFVRTFRELFGLDNQIQVNQSSWSSKAAKPVIDVQIATISGPENS